MHVSWYTIHLSLEQYIHYGIIYSTIGKGAKHSPIIQIGLLYFPLNIVSVVYCVARFMRMIQCDILRPKVDSLLLRKQRKLLSFCINLVNL